MRPPFYSSFTSVSTLRLERQPAALRRGALAPPPPGAGPVGVGVGRHAPPPSGALSFAAEEHGAAAPRHLANGKGHL